MSDFQLDEVVDVTIKGVRILGEDARGHVTIAVENGDAYPLPPQAAIERVAPPEWPPQPGDLWRDTRGSLWFALYDNYGGNLVMLPADPTKGLTAFKPDVVLAKIGPLTLVRREGSTS